MGQASLDFVSWWSPTLMKFVPEQKELLVNPKKRKEKKEKNPVVLELGTLRLKERVVTTGHESLGES